MSLADLIVQAESGGDANAKNPNSSASGPSQFINSTWLATIKAARPDLADGKSDAELLALKTDPQLSREMTDAYAAQNQSILQKNGLPVTPGTTYLAHFAGPKGAVSLLQADPNAPAAGLLGEAAVKANPFLKNMTVGGLLAWADKKMGGSQPAPAAPASPPRAPVVLPSAPAAQPAQQASQQLQQAPQQAAAADYPIQIPTEQAIQAPHIQFAQRRPVNMTGLRIAPRGPILFS
jgi:hypothetical protein